MSWAGRRRAGTTLVELLVGLLLMGFICGALYKVLIRSRTMASITAAKGELKDMTDKVLKQMQRDIEASKGKVVRGGTGLVGSMDLGITATSLSMQVPRQGTTGANYQAVTWTFARPNLSRQGDGVTKTLCDRVASWAVEKTSDSQVLIKMATTMVPAGVTKEVIHEQNLLVTVKEAIAPVDPTWRSTNEVSGF